MRRILTLVAVMAAALAVPGCGRPGPSAPTPSPTTPIVSPSASPASPPGQALAVYYTVTRPGRAPRLVREFHPAAATPDSAAHVRAAVTEMLTHKAFDPDYVNLWPASARVLNTSVAGGIATVDFSGAATANLGSEASAVALAQLVWTVTAVPNIDAVVIMLDGKPTTELWGHLDISEPQRRSKAVDALHPVWLISPQHGDRVGREVTLHIAGIAYEANVNYEVKRGETVVIKDGYITLSAAGPAFGEAKKTIKLDQPGTYVITAYLESSADGSREAIDDHTITVN